MRVLIGDWVYWNLINCNLSTRSLVVKALCYKSEGRGFDAQWGGFLNLPNPSGRFAFVHVVVISDERARLQFTTAAGHPQLKFKFKILVYYDGRSAGQSISVSAPHLGPMTRFLLLSDICGLHPEGRPLGREDGSVIYSYNSLSLSGPSPAELMGTSPCLIWE
jgi:hypothetical protein